MQSKKNGYYLANGDPWDLLTAIIELSSEAILLKSALMSIRGSLI
jgi:hypothetical protein